MFRTDALATALADRYTIERLIGEGGMGSFLSSTCATIVASRSRCSAPISAPSSADRFQAEIEVTANLQHPNLLPPFDSGVAGDPSL